MATAQLTDIYNFLLHPDGLGTAGQPTAEQLQAIKDAGYEVVINLAMGNTPRDLPNEAELLAEKGLDYVHIPVEWEAPTAENLSQFFAAMEANQDKKCFVHCIANMRVSAFVFLYRVLRQGAARAEAEAIMKKLLQPNATWQTFIDNALATQQS